MDLIVYIDESGTHAGSPLTVMAGYISSPERWNAFEAEWESFLKTQRIDHLHSKELYHGQKYFRNLPWERRAEIGDQATAIINRHAMLGFVVVLDNKDYQEIFKDAASPRNVSLDSKYGVCFRLALSFLPELVNLIDKEENHKIFLVLESGAENQGAAPMMLEQYRMVAERSLARMVRNVAFAGKRECFGVQAADLLAFTSLRCEREGNAKAESTDLVAMNFSAEGGFQGVLRLPVTREILIGVREGHIELAKVRKRLPRGALGAMAAARDATNEYLDMQEAAKDQDDG